ncbi:MAG TPA: glycyl radical protein [Bacteroidales bacterium]|nr:glycyl radical protein [Bacteroidales bacterium]HPS16411.1 glycyl radical protein [Bacteroidales bacterium]
MNQRIKKLREQSLNAVNKISAERALLVTEFYKNDLVHGLSYPVERAYCLKHILENKFICINDGELIVGERGPAPKATPTYPEINVHSLEDLRILDSREKVFFKVDDETKKAYKEIIIPFWKGKSHRDRMFLVLSDEWKEAYSAGMFTEFQEQRAPGHTVLGKKIYEKGMLDIKKDISISLNNLDFNNDKKAFEKHEELDAMNIVADAIINFAKRHAEKLDELAKKEKNKERKIELEEMAKVCRHVPANKPRTFHEALQYYWFVHLGVITELNPWDSFNPGRLDQHLYPFYKKEIEAGTLTKERVCELLQAFWIKFNNQPSPPKVGVTAQESNTYTDFSLINLGGLTENGSDAVNELSFLILDVIEEMRLLQPSSMIQISKDNPEKFLQRALKIVKTGFGQPSIFNTDEIVQELVRQGKKVEDARNGGASGCVESGAFGTESYILTGYFNLEKILELVLHNGVDPLTRKQLGIKTGNPCDFKSFDDLLNAYKKQLNHFIEIKIEGNKIIEKLFATYLPAPFLSILIDDCIANAKDYNAGGARYNTSYIQGVGLGSLSDCLTSLKYHVFDKKSFTMKEMLEAIDNNFEEHDKLRYELIYNTPKYGNDDDYADANSKRIFELFFEAVDGKPTARGGVFRINLLPTTSHVYFGSKINAMPDGRKAKEPLSEGISPVQGADKNGPTSVIKSASKIDHTRTGGTLLNQKFSPQFFNNDESIAKLGSLVRSYFKLNGHHIQFNVVNAEILKDAQKHPEKHRDLIVRVAGYSDYFNDLGVDLQNEIIKRTEHKDVI